MAPPSSTAPLALSQQQSFHPQNHGIYLVLKHPPPAPPPTRDSSPIASSYSRYSSPSSSLPASPPSSSSSSSSARDEEKDVWAGPQTGNGKGKCKIRLVIKNSSRSSNVGFGGSAAGKNKGNEEGLETKEGEERQEEKKFYIRFPIKKHERGRIQDL